jgi:site-specific DNA recombinase
MYWDQEPVAPRNGHILVVGIVARISGCAKQKEISLEDQVDHCKEVAAELYGGPTDFVVISTKGKGERLDRAELAQIESLLR